MAKSMLRPAALALLVGLTRPALAGSQASTNRVRAVRPPATVTLCDGAFLAGWKLVFCDDFNASTFSERNYWNPNGTWVTAVGGTHGNELQYYTRFDKSFFSQCAKGGVNHVQAGGTLKIVTKREPGSYEVWHSDAAHTTPENPSGFYTQCESFAYTSGIIQTPFNFLYGYFETRARIPDGGHVLWPAFWLWEGGGSTYREIDIIEFGACQLQDNFAGFNLHIARELDNGTVQTPSDGINHYPGYYILSGDSATLSDWHTYAVKWSPNSVIWYVDDREVYRVVAHTPHADMKLIANMAIAPWCDPVGNKSNLTATAFPYAFELDYIRVYQSVDEEFLTQWANRGDYVFAGWNMNPGDQFIAGDFEGNGHDELLAVALNGWAKVLRFDQGDWRGVWHNGGSDLVAGWQINPGDQFIAGDFDGAGRSEVLAIARNGWSKLLRFDGGQWHDVWGNGGFDLIAGWYINAGDQFIAGRFDGDGRDELLAVGLNGWSKLLRFDLGDWRDVWGNGGSDFIAGWYINPGDQFIVGNWDGTGDRILAVARNGWSKILRYDGGRWRDVWSNGGSDLIAGWYINPGDQFLSGDFEHIGRSDILAVATNGWSKLLRFDSGQWHDVWHNDGAGTIDLWYMAPTDRFIPLDADGDRKEDILAISSNGWTHLLQRRSILQY
jgi:beta-glucanase (GH16 family)